MDFVVFLRAVNVGGRRVGVKALADELGLVNVGAAGTFVAKKAKSAPALAKAIRARLPFECEIMVCSGEELRALVASQPFAREALPPAARTYVTILACPPQKRPALPICDPPGDAWETSLVRLEGRFALCTRVPRGGPRIVYPNELVERHLGVAATTRDYKTIVKIAGLLAR